MTEPVEPSAKVEDARGAEVIQVVETLLRHMEIDAQVEAKPLSGGSISIAVSPSEPLAGVPALKRSPFSDALQYLTNKLVNRPGAEKRWITLGIGGHREPKPQAGAARAPSAGAQREAKPARGPKARATPSRASAEEASELTLEVPEDPALAAAGRALAERAANKGRHYAIFAMAPEARAVVVRACQEVPGVRVSGVGEGRCRRVVMTPARPVPMPRRKSPVEVDEDEDDEALD